MSLPEVLIAVALTGVVILSVMTLFTLGRRNVYSGKQMSAANAVATRVLEDMALDDRDGRLRRTSASPIRRRWPTIPSPASRSRAACCATRTAPSHGTTDPSGFLGRWRDLVTTGNRCNSGRLILVDHAGESDGRRQSRDRPPRSSRVHGVVQWNEGVRRRTVTFDTSKLHPAVTEGFMNQNDARSNAVCRSSRSSSPWRCSSIIMAIALLIYDRSNKIFKTSVESADMQQNTRAAFDRMVSEIRMMGFDYDRDGVPVRCARRGRGRRRRRTRKGSSSRR